MSLMKRFAEQVMVEMGKDELDEAVLAEAQRRLVEAHRRLDAPRDGQFWLSYEVDAGGEAVFDHSQVYTVGRHMQWHWTAFISDLAAHADAGKWRVVEETSTRKVVVYDEQEIRMTVFQLVTITLTPTNWTEALKVAAAAFVETMQASQFKPVGVCMQDGTHLTDCDADGYCNYCGEQ